MKQYREIFVEESYKNSEGTKAVVKLANKGFFYMLEMDENDLGALIEDLRLVQEDLLQIQDRNAIDEIEESEIVFEEFEEEDEETENCDCGKEFCNYPDCEDEKEKDKKRGKGKKKK